MKRQVRGRNLRVEIIMGFIFLVLLNIGVFMVFSINYTRNALEQNSRSNNEALVEQVNANIEYYMDFMDDFSQIVIENTEIEQYLFGEDSAEESLEADFVEVVKILFLVRKDICNIAVLGDNGRYFINFGKDELNQDAHLEKKGWYKKAKESGEDTYISSSHVQNMVKGRYDWVVTMSKGIVNHSTEKVEGMLLIDLNYNVISDLCESVSLGKRGYIYIVDGDGKMVYHPQQQLILSNMKKELLKEIVNQDGSRTYIDEKGEQKIYTPYHSGKTGWTIVGVVYTSELVENETEVKMIYLMIAMLLVLLAVLMAVVMTGNITRPIEQLQQAMDQVKEGDLQPVQLQVSGENEIFKLQQNFNRMVRRIDELMKENIHKEEEKRELEMKVLQSQINPHFLYNTLDSIIWMIEAEEPDRAIQMTSALARFFRQAIGKSEVFITLWEELEYTRNYLLIQKMRYEDKIEYSIEVDEELMKCRILKLVLQPLVENALYHGLKYKESRGEIRIVGYQMSDKVILKVIDNGIGMDEETLERITNGKPETVKGRYGIGIGNVKRRIQTYYGEEYGIEIESKEHVGTSVTVVIPYEI